MEQAEITIFFILTNIVLLIFVAGTIIFIFQFRQKKLKYEMEKRGIHEQHRIELLNAQLDIQHQTMQHIGSEIHDSVGQKLTLAVLYARQLAQRNQFPGLTEKIDTIGNIINDSLEELRLLSRTLNYPQLAHAGLVELLQNECVQVNALGGCHVLLECNIATIDLPSSGKYLLFRILQEFIQNSLKHSECRHIHIQLDVQADGLSVRAADDGKGFNLEDAPKGIGLSNMERRAQQLGTDFNLQSSAGNGTVLTLHLPVANKYNPPQHEV